MARDDSVKRARVEDGRRDEPRTERRWGARKDDVSGYESAEDNRT